MGPIAPRTWLMTLPIGMLVSLLWWGVADGPRAHAQPVSTTPPPSKAETAWMEGVPGDVQRRARDVFLAGNAHMDEQQYPEAADKYEEALQLWAHPAFHYNLAVAQINLKQLIAAYRNLVKACSQGPKPLGVEKYQEAKNYIKLLKSQLAELTLVCEAPRAVVSLDGEQLFVGPGQHTDLALPGGHQLVVEMPGGIPYTRSLVLAPGESSRHVVAPGVLVPVRRWAAWKPWAVTAVGGVILAGAGYANARAFGDLGEIKQNFEERCRPGCTEMPEDIESSLDGIESQRGLSLAGLALGGAVLVTSTVLLYLNRERLVRKPERPAAVTLSPLVAEDGAIGIHALGRF